MNAQSFHHGYSARHTTELLGGACMFVMLILALLVSAYLMLNSGSIILGTEMNTNGQVEYLCLGSGCESLHDMDW